MIDSLTSVPASDVMSEPEVRAPEAVAFRPRRDDLVRARRGGYELRGTENGDKPTLRGHFAVFDEWTEVDSAYEGHFLERIAPGAFGKTFSETTPKVTFNHGHDPNLGDKVLGTIETLREDDKGAFYEVSLFDGIDPLLLSGLRAGEYGASFRFSVMREDFVRTPDRSDHNPEGLPERTIREARVQEFGPVSFPAYAGASAAVRSLTDEYETTKAAADPKRLLNLIEYARDVTAPSEHSAGEPHPEPERRDPEPVPEPAPALRKEAPTMEVEVLRSKEEKSARIAELTAELVAIKDEYPGVPPAEAQSRWDEADENVKRVQADLDAQERMEARIGELSTRDTNTVKPVQPFEAPRAKPINIYDKAEVWRDARSPEDAAHRFRDNAMRAVETATFPHERANTEDARGDIEKLLQKSDSPDGDLAKRILTTGSPTYRRAFGKALKAGSLDSLTNEERTVMAEGAGATGGFAITFDLDPTIVKTSNGAVNPFRRACRVVSISGTNEWRGVSSGAVVATYEAEATEAVDRSPTLAQPAFVTQRAQTFIPFSIELDQDWGSLQSELAGLIQDSKDTLEAAQFATGVGTTVFPQGLTVGATATATSGTTTVLAVNDIYKTEEALAPRFRPKAQWFANRFIYNKVRQLDTAGGANLWVPDLRLGIPANETGNTGYNLIGYPANEASGMAASLATTTKLAVLGDPDFYVIVERIGLDVELIPHLFGTTANYPTGQRGIYAMWRNTGRVFNAAGFVTLVGL